MAGTFGLKSQFYDLSMSAGAGLFEQVEEARVDYVVTTCGTCNMQIAQGAGQKVEHLAKILCESYRAYDRLGTPHTVSIEIGKEKEPAGAADAEMIE